MFWAKVLINLFIFCICCISFSIVFYYLFICIIITINIFCCLYYENVFIFLQLNLTKQNCSCIYVAIRKQGKREFGCVIVPFDSDKSGGRSNVLNIYPDF